MVFILIDQSLVVQEGIFIVMAVIHDKLAPAVDGVADCSYGIRDYTVQQIIRILCQLWQAVHIQANQCQATTADRQGVIAAYHCVITHVFPV